MADDENGEVPLTGPAVFDKDLYGGSDKFAGFTTSIADEEEEAEQRPAPSRCVMVCKIMLLHFLTTPPVCAGRCAGLPQTTCQTQRLTIR